MASEYGTGNLNPTNVYAEVALLDVIEAWIASDPFIEMKPVPKNKTEVALWSRAEIPEANTTPVSEGASPAARSLTMAQVQGTWAEFVEIYGFTDRQVELGEFDVVKAAKDVLAELVAITREEYAWSIWKAGNNVFYNSSSITAQTDINGTITAGRIDKVIALLHNNRAKVFQQASKGAMQQGTVPMPSSYVCFGHTDMLSDLRNLSGWREACEVGGRTSPSPYWAGSFRNVDFVLSPHFRSTPDVGATASGTGMFSTTGTDVDAYQLVFFGRGALGRGSLKGMKTPSGRGGVEIKVLDKADKSDPANQRVYVSTKHWDNPIILVQPHVCRIECGRTANP